MRKYGVSILLAILLGFSIAAQPYNVAIVQDPDSENYKALVEAIGAATGATFEYQIVPMDRVVFLVESGRADIGLPILGTKASAEAAARSHDYSTASIYETSFVLYSNKAKSVDVEKLKHGNSEGYTIEAANPDLYDFSASPSYSAEGSLMKVDTESIDGYVHSQISTDVILKATGLKSIKRQFYDDYDLVFILQKEARGGKLDKLLADGMAKVKSNGRFDTILGDIAKASKYDDWQP